MDFGKKAKKIFGTKNAGRFSIFFCERAVTPEGVMLLPTTHN